MVNTLSRGLMVSALCTAWLLACGNSDDGSSPAAAAGASGSAAMPTAGSSSAGAAVGGTAGAGETAGSSPASNGGSATAGGNTAAGDGGSVNAGSGSAGAGSSGGAGAPGAAGGAGKGGSANGPSYPYVFAVFDDSAASSDLLIYTSNDALNFNLLYDTKFTGPTGFLRDPSIIRHTDGKFYVAFTTPPTLSCCGAESSFSIASSANLKDWKTIATVPAGVAGVKNTWAPEWFKDPDGSVYVLATIDTKTHRYKAMNAELTQFSGPTFIGIGPDYIDTFIVTVGSTYHAFTKHESAGYVEHATSASIDGPWNFIGKGDWAGWGTHKEAPALIDLGNGTWRFYCDAGSTGHESYSDSSDGFKTWTAPKTLPQVGNAISHGTVIKGTQ